MIKVGFFSMADVSFSLFVCSHNTIKLQKKEKNTRSIHVRKN